MNTLCIVNTIGIASSRFIPPVTPPLFFAFTTVLTIIDSTTISIIQSIVNNKDNHCSNIINW